MSSAYGRLAAIRDYWMPRDTSARIEVRVTDLDEVLRELARVITISAPQPAPAPAASGEPFGYLWPTGMHPEFRFYQQKRDGVDGMPLYAAPQPAPARVPTDQEIIDCGPGQESAQWTYEDQVYFAREVLKLAGTPAKEAPPTTQSHP